MKKEGILRWGILGTAGISTELIRTAGLSSICEVGAVASRDAGRAESWAGEHGIPLSYGGYDDLLDAGEVDVIYNPLPNSLHAEWTIRALEAGYPVLCEKPLTANASEASKVRAAAAQTGLPVAEAFMYRFHPVYSRVFELLESGTIGTLSTISSRFTFMLDDRSAIPASRELAGGALMDVGCYCVNLSRMIAGCEPTRVSAFERRSTVDDLLVGILDFPNGVLAQFETSIANAERHRVEIAGSTGSIVLERPWLPGREEAQIKVCRWDEEDEVIKVEGADPYFLEVEDFVAVCKGLIVPRWSIDDAVCNMAVIDALYQSADVGRAVDVARVPSAR